MSKVIRECIAFTELCLVITLENLATSYYLSPGLGGEGGGGGVTWFSGGTGNSWSSTECKGGTIDNNAER